MAKRVVVSGAQQKAARYVVKSNAAKGRTTGRAVTRIADAKAAQATTPGRKAARPGAAK